MTQVQADGPSPCDLAVVGEAPGATEIEAGKPFVGPSGKVLWGDGLDLMNALVQRPRETVYVTNVCKELMPDTEWWRLSLAERDIYAGALRRELEAVRPTLVLAFGRRAAMALVPDFGTMPEDHGKARLGFNGLYVTMALWHPAAYLRGNAKALEDIVADLMTVPTLLACEGLVSLMQPPPEPAQEWPEWIGFLKHDGPRKSSKCMYCGSKEVAQYAGEELKWRLCKTHAIRAAAWAVDNAEALFEHRSEAMRVAELLRRERVEAKMRAELLGEPAKAS